MSGKLTLAAITIGQTPRTDFTGDILPLLPSDIELKEYGALDGLSYEAALRYAPHLGEPVLVTRMRDGRQIVVGEERIQPAVRACVARAEEEGAGAVLLLCTGQFPELPHVVPLIRPQALEYAAAAALCDGRPVAVLVPDEAQRGMILTRWRQAGIEPVVACASPYLGEAGVEAAAATLRGTGAALLCMDCMGYTVAMKRLTARASGMPVLLPRTLAAVVAAQVLSLQ